MGRKKQQCQAKFNTLCTMQLEDLERFSNYTQEQLTQKASEKEWSVIQVFSHLYLAQKSTFNFMEKQLKENPTPEKTSLKNAFTSILLSRVLKSKRKIKAPAKLPDPINDLDLETLKEKFDGLQQMGNNLIEAIPDKWHGKKIFKHPYVGWLNTKDTYSFVKNHWVHHRHQFSELEKILKHG